MLFSETDYSFTAYPIPELKAITGTQYFDPEGNLYIGVENAFVKVNKDALSPYTLRPQLSIVQVQTGDKIISNAGLVAQRGCA